MDGIILDENNLVEVLYNSPWGSNRRRVVGKVTRFVYGFYRKDDTLKIDKSDQEAQPDLFPMVAPPVAEETPKPTTRKRRRKKKAVEEVE